MYDVKRCCGSRSELGLAYEVQIGQAVTSGYFGGYSAKMQDIGQREVLTLQKGIVRKAAVEKSETTAQAFKQYAKHMVRDLESQGIVRTAVETTNLAVHSDEKEMKFIHIAKRSPASI